LAASNRSVGGEYYIKLLSQVSNESAEYARRISRDFFDPIARITIKALAKRLPDLDEESLTWTYIFAVGAMVASMSRTGRVSRLSGGAADPNDVSRIIALLVPFIVGGLDAVSAAEKATESGPRGPKAQRTGPANAKKRTAAFESKNGPSRRRAAVRKK
jgi:hypothetical protein